MDWSETGRADTDDTARGGLDGQDTARDTGTETGPGIGTAPDAAHDLGLALHQVSLALDRVRAGLAERLDLVPIDVNALLEVHRRPGIRPGDLARALNLKAAGTTSVTDRLVRTGYARRSADPSDRRGTCLDLTPAGQHAAAWVLQALTGSLLSEQVLDADAHTVLQDLAARLRTQNPSAA